MVVFFPILSKLASSAESVSKYRFRQITKCMIQGCLQAIERQFIAEDAVVLSDEPFSPRSLRPLR